VRLVLAVSLAALAAAPLLAQKPGTDPERERYRAQGISLCVAEMNALEGVTPDESEAMCGCGLDRLMANRPTAALASLGEGHFRSGAGGSVLACAFTEAPNRVGAVSRWMTASAPTAAPPAAVEAPPIVPADSDKPAASDSTESGGFDLRSWLDGLSLPGWLGGGLPLWAWIPLVVFVFLFLRGLRRRSEGRDLDGPPSSMRHGPPRR
jgi:hypothetical protein